VCGPDDRATTSLILLFKKTRLDIYPEYFVYSS
jgi:hypothetical protein